MSPKTNQLNIVKRFVGLDDKQKICANLIFNSCVRSPIILFTPPPKSIGSILERSTQSFMHRMLRRVDVRPTLLFLFLFLSLSRLYMHIGYIDLSECD